MQGEKERVRLQLPGEEYEYKLAFTTDGRRLGCDLLVLATPLLAWLPPALAGAAGLPGVFVAGSAARGEIDAHEAAAAGEVAGKQAAAWAWRDGETGRQGDRETC